MALSCRGCRRWAGSGSCGSIPRRQPEQTLLYQVIAEHWSSFRERAEHAGGLPKFVVDEFEAYLRCGLLEHGLAHLACSRCGHSIVVAFSCKRRGFCPSCLGRRMSDVAAHLVDEVLPKVPIRQWVCSLPWRLRYAMGYDRRLCRRRARGVHRCVATLTSAPSQALIEQIMFSEDSMRGPVTVRVQDRDPKEGLVHVARWDFMIAPK